MRLMIACLLSCVFAGSVLAQPVPEGLPPAFKVVVSTEPAKGTLIYRDIVHRSVALRVPREVEQNGVKVTIFATEYKTVVEERHVLVNVAAGRVITNDGKQLPIDEVWRRLKKDDVFAISSDSRTPATAYLRAISAETLLFIPGGEKK